ncbi:hypothetical protein [Sporosarcina sp. A2]|uniref:hypothetical protein n=1 Tax=Sporosarcina sp. A2 TaxID=3393449 RepID=UPI003D790D57
MQNARVSSYVKKNCASYAGNGLCHLETDSTGGRLCPLIYDVGKTCKYAEQAVIPGDTVIEALYNAGKAGTPDNPYYCERCNTQIVRTSNRQKYCESCAAEVRRNKRVQYDAEQYSKRL